MCIAYRLHVREESGTEQTLTFPSALLRSLALIAIANSPNSFRLEDVEPDDDEDRDELCGSTCGTACGNCGRCS
jgi:hypothetical protein